MSARAIADRIISYYGENQPGFGRGLILGRGDQVDEIVFDNYEDLIAAFGELIDVGLMKFQSGVEHGRTALDRGEMRPMVLTMAGWNRFEQLKRTNADSQSAFMAMKFGNKQMNRVFERDFRPAVKRAKLELATCRATPGLIDLQLELQIMASRVVLADLTHGCHGVYYEAGYARALGRPVIYTCRDDKFKSIRTRPHFDVAHHYCVRWTDPPTDRQMEELTTLVTLGLTDPRQINLPDSATTARGTMSDESKLNAAQTQQRFTTQPKKA